MSTGDNGISIDSASTGGTLMAIFIFLSLALYNVIELNFIIFATFKQRRGLYFWSFLVATWGVAVYSGGFIMKAMQLTHLNWVFVTLIVVGWCSMVTGQSVVLYSRLHIIIRDTKILRAVVYMIIFDATICHLPIAVMVYGANSSNSGPFIKPYSIYEKVQVTIFFIQEIIISGLYIMETAKLMRAQRDLRSNRTRRLLMIHLVVVNIIVILLDITILALEYVGLYDLQTAYKALVYSVKLKMEFSILNKLVDIVRGSTGGSSYDHTQGESGGLHLESVDNKRKKRMTGGRGVGHSTYVSAVGNGNTRPGGTSVVMTREVIVRREEVCLDEDSDMARDAESIGVSDGRVGARDHAEPEIAAARKTLGMQSSSESEEHFARLSY